MRKKNATLAASLLLALSLAACKPTPSYDPAAFGPLFTEARKEGENYWETKVFSRCGDSHYTASDTGMIYQLKGNLLLSTIPEQGMKITEADRLNGVEWRGTSMALPDTKGVYRYTVGGKWTEWANGSPIVLGILSVPVRKVKGKWEFGKAYAGINNRTLFAPVNCSQVGSIPEP